MDQKMLLISNHICHGKVFLVQNKMMQRRINVHHHYVSDIYSGTGAAVRLSTSFPSGRKVDNSYLHIYRKVVSSIRKFNTTEYLYYMEILVFYCFTRTR